MWRIAVAGIRQESSGCGAPRLLFRSRPMLKPLSKSSEFIVHVQVSWISFSRTRRVSYSSSRICAGFADVRRLQKKNLFDIHSSHQRWIKEIRYKGNSWNTLPDYYLDSYVPIIFYLFFLFLFEFADNFNKRANENLKSVLIILLKKLKRCVIKMRAYSTERPLTPQITGTFVSHAILRLIILD